LIDTRALIEQRVDAEMSDRLKKQQESFQKQTDELSRQVEELQKQLKERSSPKGSARSGSRQ
jgi:sugar-specific transcriptional regulator TrmB